MAAWKIRITGIKSTQGLETLVKMLCRLPGITPESAVQGLRRPPLDLPQVPSETDAKKLQLVLSKLGAVVEIEPVGKNIGEAAIKNATAPSPKTQVEHASNEAPRGMGIEARGPDPHGTTGPVELREREIRPPIITAKIKEKSPAPVRQLLVFGAIVIVIVALAQWMPSASKVAKPESKATKNAQTEPELSIDPAPQQADERNSAKPESKSQLESETPSTQAEPPPQLDLARKQQQHAEKLMQQAQSEADPHKAAQALEQSLRYDPHNENGWAELVKRMRTNGDAEGERKAQQGLEQSERVRQTLESIAKAFGTEGQVKVSTAQVLVQTSQAEMEQDEFDSLGSEMGDSIRTKFPSQEIVIENLGSQGKQSYRRLD